MRIVRVFLIAFTATLIALFLLVLFVLGGTRVVSTGTYGPFTIGEEKSQSLATLERLGAWPAEPYLFRDTLLEAPNKTELQSNFWEDEGITVWFGRPYGVPIRLEFFGDTLERTWPTFEPKTWSNPNPGYDEIYAVMLDFQDQVTIGMSRNDVFELIAGNEMDLTAFVSNHVARAYDFRTQTYEQRLTDPSYSAFVYETSGWSFTGLDHLVWYYHVVTPYYSRVTLFFENDRLQRIEHFHGPTELP